MMKDPNEITSHLFRTEYSKIVAVLCKVFDIEHIEIAEDIAGETFLKASEYWAIKGLPENPTAWLYTVAKNKAKDYYKRLAIFEKGVKEELKTGDVEWEQIVDFDTKSISDSQLEMIFAVCNPVNPQEAQICLALQVLCGFSVEEIANAFLSKTETIKKRLHRARKTLRANDFQIKSFREQDIRLRMEVVLTTLYLLFNEGYFSKTNNYLIRKDLCLEAIRLALILTDNPLTNTSQTNALLALMCFQSSRLEARTDHNGEAILFDEQDKTLWDKALIEKGNYYLIRACELGNTENSKYHLQAAIAYWHTTPEGHDKWRHILNLYNHLVVIDYSPITALSRAFVFSKVYGNREAIREVEKLDLADSEYYHGLLGYLFTDSNPDKAISHYEQAIHLTKSKAEKETLKKQVEMVKAK